MYAHYTPAGQLGQAVSCNSCRGVHRDRWRKKETGLGAEWEKEWNEKGGRRPKTSLEFRGPALEIQAYTIIAQVEIITPYPSPAREPDPTSVQEHGRRVPQNVFARKPPASARCSCTECPSFSTMFPLDCCEAPRNLKSSCAGGVYRVPLFSEGTPWFRRRSSRWWIRLQNDGAGHGARVRAASVCQNLLPLQLVPSLT